MHTGGFQDKNQFDLNQTCFERQKVSKGDLLSMEEEEIFFESDNLENERIMIEEESYYFSGKRKQREQKLLRKKTNKIHMKNDRLLISSSIVKTKRKSRLNKKEARQVTDFEKQIRPRNISKLVRQIEPKRIFQSEVKLESNNQSSFPKSQSITIDDYDILPAESLGLEEGHMYERLMSIIEGDDITPEDYELLLQLDNNNVKKTMNVDEISEIPLIVLGDEEKDKILFESSSTCDICLESFQELPKYAQVRQLPCNHVFCKQCIDHWFAEVSTKCPNLSCYWHNANSCGDRDC